MKKLIISLLGLLLPLGAWAQTDWKALTHYEKAPVKKQLAARLMDYVKFDTQSQPSAKVPSTSGQLKFAKALAKELKKNGVTQVKVDKFGLVTAEIPSNLDKPAPVVALVTHLDSTPGFTSQNVRPQLHTYKGSDIVVDAAHGVTLNTYNAPQLLRAKGHDIITASGNTVLGADGKAGAAILLTVAQYFYDHPQLSHGTIKLVFSPDSYTGTGIRHLDTKTLGADYAYTLDAGEMGQLVDETFSAKSFKAVFEGNRSVDIGRASSSPFADNLLMASDFHTLLSRTKRPETTAYKNGFIYVSDITTQGNRTEVSGILRAFSDEEMNTLTQEVNRAFSVVKTMNPKGKNFSLTFGEQDKNLQNVIPALSLRKAEEALQAEEITPIRTASRTTSDGARLAEKGLAAPGLSTGYYNNPGFLEYADVDVMEASFRSVMRLMSLWATEPVNAK